jgi:predicted TIM-barrel fold metal-dependent hydrolase
MRAFTPRFPIPKHGSILALDFMSDSTSTATSASSPARPGFLRRWLRRLVIGLPLLLLALLIARTIFFSGPFRPVEPLPQSPVIDLHCHTAGIGAGDSGCLISPALRGNFRFKIYLESFGVTELELQEHGDGLVIQRISERVAASRHVDQAVVLALDGVVNDQGELDRVRTEYHVPNEFVAREVAKHTNLLWGASVNPHRRDALERLAWAKTNGAVLVKWIPSIMGIDPADEALRPFYLKLKELALPLLTHGGQEKSFTHARDELADPVRLKLPLELGVTVIVAHIASTGSNEGQEDFERLLPMFATYPNLYSEISSLTQANKLGYLRRTLADSRLKGRLLYGTDYPLINTALVTPWAFPLNLTRQQMADLSAIENPFDRDVALKQALGVPEEVFAATAEVLGVTARRR